MKNYVKSLFYLAALAPFTIPLMAMEPENIEQFAEQEVILDEKTVLEHNLLLAAHTGNLEEVRNFLAQGVDINCRAPENGECITPLGVAAAEGHLSVVEYLLDNDAAIDMPKIDDMTPLMCAADYGHLNVVQLLIRRGAQINLQAERANKASALMCAVRNGNAAVVDFLVQSGADPMLQDEKGYTILARADGCPIGRMIHFLSLIPFNHYRMLKNCFFGIAAFNRFCENVSPELPPEMRCAITSKLLKLLVEDRIIQIRKLFAITNNDGHNAHDVILIDREKALNAHQEICQSLKSSEDQEERENMLAHLNQCEKYIENCNLMARLFDLNDPESIQILVLRKQLCSNIKKIMFKNESLP